MTSAWLSGVVVVRDAGEMIDACLASLAGVDELVVIDHASADDTAERAARAGARVVQVPSEATLGGLRARAHDECRGVWVVFLDADERLPRGGLDALRASLARLPESVSAVRLPFDNRLGDVTLRWGGFAPARRVRAYRRSDCHWASSDRVHEVLKRLRGRTVCLDTLTVTHLTYRDLAHAEAKLMTYARLGAEAAFEAGRRPRRVRAVVKALGRALRDTLLRAAWLDGRAGLRLVWVRARATWARELYLADLWRRIVR